MGRTYQSQECPFGVELLLGRDWQKLFVESKGRVIADLNNDTSDVEVFLDTIGKFFEDTGMEGSHISPMI